MKKFYLFFFLSCLSSLVFAQSSITWSAPINVAASSFDNMHPRIVTDRSGNPLVIWGRMSDESVFISRWNGTNFTTPVKINPSWLSVATQSWMGPDIASKGDTVYVVMKRTPEMPDTNHIYISRSINGGVTFSNPIQVDDIADSVSRFPTVTVDNNGNPLVGFMKFNSMFTNPRWAVAKSNNLGNTFFNDVKASGWTGGEVCDCCPGSIVSKDNSVAMLYRANIGNIRDNWVGYSNNGGTSFSNGWNVDNNNWMLMACPSSGPDGAIIADTLYSVFMNGDSGTDRVYVSFSSVTGMSAGSARPLTGSITNLYSQNYPRIANINNALAIVWKQNVNGNDELALRFTNDVGLTSLSTYEVVDLNDVTNADVALANTSIYIVWQDDNSGTVKFRKGTYTSTLSVTDHQVKDNLSVFPSPVSEMLNIRLNLTEKGKISITNVIGQEMFSSQVLGYESQLEIKTSEWQPGVYFVTMRSGNNTIIQKICK